METPGAFRRDRMIRTLVEAVGFGLLVVGTHVFIVDVQSFVTVAASIPILLGSLVGILGGISTAGKWPGWQTFTLIVLLFVGALTLSWTLAVYAVGPGEESVQIPAFCLSAYAAASAASRITADDRESA